ncbi:MULTISPECIES: oxidoreductase [unclassified Devosia]|uniref:oxidoreductase n=1 Tax=unclassified Devosia TaxID=196773 RepID=UPI001557B586|nr:MULTISPECIES: oxidoreductase [unclassified Devosia]
MNMKLYLSLLTSAAMIVCSTLGAVALDVPTAQPILTVSGNITQTNQDGVAVFDRTMLEALGNAAIVTRTPWFDGVSTYEGVPLEALMDAVGAEGHTVTAIALNDYVTTIPLSDFADFGPILALRHNGQYMTVREKGPLFIIYPFDENPDLRTSTYYGRAAWQVKQLIVE